MKPTSTQLINHKGLILILLIILTDFASAQTADRPEQGAMLTEADQKSKNEARESSGSSSSLVRSRTPQNLDNTLILEFTKYGVLQGQLTDEIGEDFLVARVRLTYDEFKDEVKGVVKKYFTMLTNIEKNKKKLESIGINVGDLKKEIDSKIRPFINNYSRALIGYDYIQKLNLLLGESKHSGEEYGNNFPDPTSFLLPHDRYTLEVIFYDDDGIPIESNNVVCGTCTDIKIIDTLRTNCGQCEKEPLWYLSQKIDIPNQAVRFEYELKEVNSTYRMIQARVNAGIAKAPIQKDLEDLKSLVDELMTMDMPVNSPESKFIEQSRKIALEFDKEGTANPILTSLNGTRNTVTSITTNKRDTLLYSHPAYLNLKDWVTYWLWLNKGIPSVNPLKTYFDFNVVKKVPLTKKTIAESQYELDSLQARIDFLTNLIENKNLSLENFTKEYGSERDHVKRIIPRIKILTEAIAKTKKRIEDANALMNTRKLYNQLLYEGVFMTHSFDQRNYMRNHNALNDFMIMGDYRVEINEIEQMNVLVHNLTSTDIVNVTFTFSEAVEQSLLEDQLDKVFSDAPDYDLYDEKQAEVIDEIMKELAKVKKLKELLDKGQIEDLVKFPPVGTSDKTASYMTKEWSHERPSSFSSYVDYTITTGKGDKKETEAKGRYRMNKLFRYRVKAGLIYSSLEMKDYTIDEVTNTVSSDIENYGLNATAGIQIFIDPGGLDIRQRGLLREDQGWFTYVGLALGEETVENWLIGAGKEVVSGVGLMIGWHLGQTEELNVSGGIPEIHNGKFTSGMYYSLVVDLSVFNQFFGLRNNANPLKKN